MHHCRQTSLDRLNNIIIFKWISHGVPGNIITILIILDRSREVLVQLKFFTHTFSILDYDYFIGILGVNIDINDVLIKHTAVFFTWIFLKWTKGRNTSRCIGPWNWLHHSCSPGNQPCINLRNHIDQHYMVHLGSTDRQHLPLIYNWDIALCSWTLLVLFLLVLYQSIPTSCQYYPKMRYQGVQIYQNLYRISRS